MTPPVARLRGSGGGGTELQPPEGLGRADQEHVEGTWPERSEGRGP